MDLWDPQAYDSWYETPLGKTSDRLERELVFSTADVREAGAFLAAVATKA
ncbi:MAG: hypothetical protein HY891_06935 [Deltaproteobacteria bacterium]|nr:hypothetical protein [Deltaproteobacteria bacterium]